MKTIKTPALKTPAPKKEIRTPLTDWVQPVYSESALRIMEIATGQKFARAGRPAVQAPVTVAVDKD